MPARTPNVGFSHFFFGERLTSYEIVVGTVIGHHLPMLWPFGTFRTVQTCIISLTHANMWVISQQKFAINPLCKCSGAFMANVLSVAVTRVESTYGAHKQAKFFKYYNTEKVGSTRTHSSENSQRSLHGRISDYSGHNGVFYHFPCHTTMLSYFFSIFHPTTTTT